MDLRHFLIGMAVIGVLGVVGNVVFAQWPGGQSTSTSNPGGWPGSHPAPTEKYVDPDADKFVCTFDYARGGHAMTALEMGSSGKPRCPARRTNYGSHFSGDRLSILSNLIRSTGTREDRIVAIEKRGFRNAGAMQCEDVSGEIKQLIIWDPDFLGELDRQAGTEWASVAVLAHELAHHHNNDTGQNPGRIPAHKRKEQELFADRWAGQKLREFGSSRQEAVAVFHFMGEGGDTHPPSRLRVTAAGEGWDRAGNGSVPNPSPAPNRGPGPAPQQVSRIAMACWTQFGACQMMQPVYLGSACYCTTYMGPLPGVAR